MRTIYWGHTKITTISEDEINDLQTLLPYWGMLLDTNKREIINGLTNCSVSINGIESHVYRKLQTSLQHTGVNISSNQEKKSANIDISVCVEETLTYPISLTLMNMTYNLRTVTKEYVDLNKIIHQGIWFPRKGSPIVVRIHPKEEQNTVKWLSYLIIQAFLRKSFEPLGGISLSVYRKIVTTVLSSINQDFSQFQNIKKNSASDWPETPNVPAYLQHHSLQSTTSNQKKHSIQPFHKKKINKEESPFNPFKFQDKSQKTSIINPFQKGGE
ncbi:hypothetical protein ABFG93_03320 [Pseudalkalibacillus hwajinpoensis]|uniref:hypothetical protein n=1 Tax=Guptibacillus hwajinpoensis TaxID=208199 RepID=UPI00325B66E0